mmetsp:Transcript_11693/g.24610  ORF Transcript_11693/g.24610 Transcript_11693/m.24610 type:complete len:202 (+) Transcript_11693:757-1362(+)
MLLKMAHQLAATHLPDPHVALTATRHDIALVVAEAERTDPRSMRLVNEPKKLARVRLVCPHPPVFPACDYEVQRIGQAVRLARVAHSDCGEHRVVARIPDADRAVRAQGSKPVRGIGGKRDPLDSRSVVLANQQRLQVVHAQAVHEAGRGARDDLDLVWREREGRYRTRELHLASVVHVRIEGSYGAVPAAHHETLWPAEQ